MKYFSTFSGIGGFELGIGDKAECVGYSEIDKYAIEVYEKHFNHKNYGDITTIKAEELPEFDFLVGGFPCQAFSIAGRRGGFDDTRGTLFFEIARIIREKQPRFFVLENVRGLLSHDKGNTFNTIISTIDELGYDAEWQVLNSKNHGVPQNRERIFIIGYARGKSRSKIFPLGQTTGSDTKRIQVVGELSSETWQKRNESIRRVYDPKGIAPTIPTGTGGGVMPKIANTIDANYFKGMNRNPGHASSNRGYEIEGKIRRLTPTECARLQGFPDDWCDGLSDTQKYKTLGNAVTVNVIKDIFNEIL